MSDELKDRVKNIANQNIVINGEKKSILNQNEVDFLNISRGTLSKEDIKIMEDHVVLTYELFTTPVNLLVSPKNSVT